MEYEISGTKKSMTFKHMCNLTNRLSNDVNNFGLQKLQTHYSHLTKMMEKIMDLPEVINFGAANMCTFCSTLWRPGNYVVRTTNKKGKKRKHMKTKQKQRIIELKCLNCNKKSTVSINKPKRKKIMKEKRSVPVTLELQKKKKKKRIKDKFCNLNISTNGNLNTSTNSNLNSSLLNGSLLNNSAKIITPIQKKKILKPQQKLTPVQKLTQVSKLKLESILNNAATKKRKSGLSSFLNEIF